MKVAAALVILMAFGFTDANASTLGEAGSVRRLQTAGDLAEKWRIDTVDVSQDPNAPNTMVLTASHGLGDGTTLPSLSITGNTDALSEDADITLACPSQGTWSPALGSAVQGDEPVGLETTALSLSPGTESTWSFQVADGIETNSNIFVDDPVSPKAIFCVVFEFGNNFREIAVEVSMTLDGSFAIDSSNAIDVQARVASQDKDIEVSFGVTAELCGGGPAVVNQGNAIGVCVCSDNYPTASVIGFNNLAFSQAGFVSENGNFDAVSDGAFDPMGAENLGCGIFDLGGIEKQCCRVDALLPPAFFMDINDATNLMDVTAIGSVVLDIVSDEPVADLTLYEPPTTGGINNWEEAEQFCQNQGHLRLATHEEWCPGFDPTSNIGAPELLFGNLVVSNNLTTDQWAPVDDGYNKYIQVGCWRGTCSSSDHAVQCLTHEVIASDPAPPSWGESSSLTQERWESNYVLCYGTSRRLVEAHHGLQDGEKAIVDEEEMRPFQMELVVVSDRSSAVNQLESSGAYAPHILYYYDFIAAIGIAMLGLMMMM